MAYPYQIKTIEAYHRAREKSIDNPEAFWEEIAATFYWQERWKQVLKWDFRTPKIQWFIGGKLNITENCLDRHLADKGDQPALIWEANHPDERERIFTYRELHFKVMQFAHVLRNNGVAKGDRVCIYMGMVPELPIALLACARIGAVHSVIFGGFSAQSIADRLQDAGAKYMITCDGAYRGGKQISLKDIADQALTHCDFVNRVIVLQRTGSEVYMETGRDVWWHDEIEKVVAMGNPDFPAVAMDAEDPLFILYTSGSTGKPKGVLHTCAGYMVFTTYTFVNVFQYQPGDRYFCTADIGWVTGHSYIVYGPLCAGATTVQYEGLPSWPKPSRLFDLIDKFGIHILYTAPTAIRSLMSLGQRPSDTNNLSSLKVLGSVGEPINEEAWQWLFREVGGERCPVVDTWWQTETGGIMISNLAGVTPAIPSFATLPLPGIQPVIMDENGKEAAPEPDENGRLRSSGNLCFQFPWPGMLRGTWGDPERFKKTYFSAYDGLYFSGDGCYRDDKGNYRITGRVDDVLNVSGHRLGTAELENAINHHPHIIESAVVGFPHPIKGQGIYAFVIADDTLAPDEETGREEIANTVTQEIGPIARPDKIQFVANLPKTRSGKIMRRILRQIAQGQTDHIGDTSSLLDPDVVPVIVQGRV